MELPLVLGMKQIERWISTDWGRSYKFLGLQFRLYTIRGLKSHKGAWYLHKLRDEKFWRYKGPPTVRADREKFIREVTDWAEKYADDRGWVYAPEAGHLMRTSDLSESFQVMLEIEVLAQRGE